MVKDLQSDKLSPEKDSQLVSVIITLHNHRLCAKSKWLMWGEEFHSPWSDLLCLLCTFELWWEINLGCLRWWRNWRWWWYQLCENKQLWTLVMLVFCSYLITPGTHYGWIKIEEFLFIGDSSWRRFCVLKAAWFSVWQRKMEKVHSCAVPNRVVAAHFKCVFGELMRTSAYKPVSVGKRNIATCRFFTKMQAYSTERHKIHH